MDNRFKELKEPLYQGTNYNLIDNIKEYGLLSINEKKSILKVRKK